MSEYLRIKLKYIFKNKNRDEKKIMRFVLCNVIGKRRGELLYGDEEKGVWH